jgi:hypothetical protein
VITRSKRILFSQSVSSASEQVVGAVVAAGRSLTVSIPAALPRLSLPECRLVDEFHVHHRLTFRPCGTSPRTMETNSRKFQRSAGGAASVDGRLPRGSLHTG